jgi:hypothetical protein
MASTRRFVLVLASAIVASSVACGPTPHAQGYFGKIVTSGPNLGTREATGYRWGRHPGMCAYDTDSGTVELDLPPPAAGLEAGQLRIPRDPKAQGVSVHVKGTDVGWKPADCTLFDVWDELSPTNGAGAKRGVNRHGKARLQCRVPGGDDTIDVDVEFEGCIVIP